MADKQKNQLIYGLFFSTLAFMTITIILISLIYTYASIGAVVCM